MSTSIQLSLLLRQDDLTVPGAIPAVLGDSYLCAHNPIYSAIRTAARNAGFDFSCQPTQLWFDYQVCPLLCLTEVLAKKTILYMPNKSFVERLVQSHPRFALSTAILLDELKVNYMFHESCHAVAHTVMSAEASPLPSLADSPAGRFVWQAVIEEAFANTLERLAGHFLHSSAHRIFYWLNSYVGHDAVPSEIISQALRSHSPSAVFRTLFLSFLAANLKPRNALTACERIPEATGTEAIPDLARIGDTLSYGFRDGTAVSYFRLNGAEEHYRSIAAQPLFVDALQWETFLAIADELFKSLPSPFPELSL